MPLPPSPESPGPSIEAELLRLRSLDRVGLALSGDLDLEARLRDLMGVVRDIFQADRAWLITPCDPAAPSWAILFEEDGAWALSAIPQGQSIPMDPSAARTLQEALEAEGPVAYGPGRPHPWEAAETHQIRSQLGVAVRTGIGAPWLLGLHQCTHPRLWSPEEQLLFAQVARRIAPGLRLLLSHRAMISSEAHRQAVIAALPDLLFHQDREGTFLDYHTPRNGELYLPPEAFLGRRVEDLLPPPLAERSMACLRAAIDDDEVKVFEYELEVVRGLRCFEARIAPCHDGTAVSVVRDVTDQRKAEAELLRTQKLDSLGVLAGGIAHDFNNILAGILGYLTLMKEEPSLGEDMLDMLGRAEMAAHRAKDLTRQLLTFARGGTPVKASASLAQLIQESVAFCLRGSRCRAELDLPEDLWPVEVDRNQISQVLQNLTLNAIQAMSGGGSIHIRAANQGQPSPGGSAGWVALTVRDEGTGIREADLPRIFDPFFTTKAKGNGLGLAIVHSIIHKHGGTIEVASNVGQGTTFTLRLPAALQAPGDQTEGPALPRGTGRILLLDDEALLRDMGSLLLRKAGYEPTTEEEGREAVEAYRSAMGGPSPFRGAILDLTIPGGMGGREAAERILALDPKAILLVSSGYSSGAEESDLACGCFKARLPKPYTFESLCRTLARVLAPPAP